VAEARVSETGERSSRASRLSGEKRRRQLVDHALKLFGRRGFEGTSLDAVAEAAGVRKQTLLYHFPSKEELFDACVMELGDRLSVQLEAVLEGPEVGWDRIEAVIRSVFRLAEEIPEFPLFAREGARHSPQVVERVASRLDPLRKRALLYLERGMEEGTFRMQDPGLLLFTLYTAVVGSLTEAGVLRAIAGGAKGSLALRRRQEELIAFVRRALEP
jgi:TetR/AcrR family transcriptional regulator